MTEYSRCWHGRLQGRYNILSVFWLILVFVNQLGREGENNSMCHFRKNDLMSFINCFTIFWAIISCYIYPFCPKTCLDPTFFYRNNHLCISLVRQIGFPIHFIGTLLPSCVNSRYNSHVTGCLSYLKILHYKVLQDACHFYI